jgi:23S rRNA (uracil1939-C5)-methyltransferase
VHPSCQPRHDSRVCLPQVDETQYTVKIHDLARGGSGVAKLDSGEVVFVPFTAIGDEALIRITKKTKNYSQGELIQLIRPADFRVTPPCKVFTVCGGCNWQHLPYEMQFDTKKKGLLHTLKRAGVSTEAIPFDEMPAKKTYSYRNRVQLRGNAADQSFGFYSKESNRIVSIDRCEIADERINQTLGSIRSEGFEKFGPEFKVEIDVADDGKVRHAWNERHAAFGFRQVNDEQNKVLQDWVSTHVGQGGLLLDLFGGFGNLSVPLMNRFEHIQCVDLSVPSQKPKGIQDHFEYFRSDVATWLKKQRFTPPQKTTVILDPPREGLGSSFAQIESCLTQYFSPEILILVGCDVDSFAKDTQRFIQQGYQLKRLGILDLFPQTIHVESLALFTK